MHETERDFEYFKSMYPAAIKGYQVKIEEVCDRMEYEGSPMYDEYPDRVMVDRVCRQICREIALEVQDGGSERPAAAEDLEEVEIYELGGRPRAGEPGFYEKMERPPLGRIPGVGDEAPDSRLESQALRNLGRTSGWAAQMNGQRRPPQGPPPWGPPPRPPRPPQGPPPWGPPPRPPRPPQPPRNWLEELIRLMLFEEWQSRRCRGRNCI